MAPPPPKVYQTKNDDGNPRDGHKPWAARPDSTESEQELKDRYFRQLYKTAPDFRHLARLDPAFASVVKDRELDFDDPKAVMQLTKTLLRLDFDLKIDLPHDRLCPPIANRHQYILWLKDLLDSTTYAPPVERRLVGLDIGTGASCIYPLLGCTERDWSFFATDIDASSLSHARANVDLNGLEARINVVASKPNSPLLALDELGVPSLDFCMTNPPFYASEAAMAESAAAKSRPPATVCTGATVEMVTEGGEVGFVGRVLQESLVLRGRVQWYTAMLGFLSSVAQVVDRLREAGIDNYAVTELVQGSKTRRWAVAWSFGGMRPIQRVARGVGGALRGRQPVKTEYVVMRAPVGGTSVGELADRLSGGIAALELVDWQWDRERLEGTGRAADKVWARAWRRRRKREGEGQKEEEKGEDKCVFGFTVAVRATTSHVTVECRWVEGHDESAMESFCGFLRTTAA